MKAFSFTRRRANRQAASGKRQGTNITIQFLPLSLSPLVLVSWWLIGVGGPASLLLGEERSVQLKTSVDNTTITVGDILHFKLEVKRPEAVKTSFPTLGPQLNDWVVRNSTRFPAKEGPAGSFSESLQLELTLYKTGDFEIPPLQVEAIRPSGEKEVLASEPIKIKVQSVLAGEPEQLKDLKAQEEIPADYKPFLMFLAAMGALGIILYRAIYYFRNRTKPAVLLQQDTRSPAEIARAAIQNLLARKLLQEGYLKEFYLELSEIIKRYLGSKLNILSLERTTEEFTGDLKQTTIPWEGFQLTKEFLMDCDLVKFAKYRPSEEEINLSVRRSFEIINATEENLKNEPVALEVSK